MLSWLFDKAAKPVVRYGYNKVKERIFNPIVYLRIVIKNDKGVLIQDIDVNFKVNASLRGKRVVTINNFLNEENILHYPDNMNFHIYNSETGKLLTKFRLPWRAKVNGINKRVNVIVD
jgi:protein associated with RNAse G/E